MVAVMRIVLACMALSFMSMLRAGETAPPPVDPFVWTPPKTAPKPREVLKGEEFEKKLAEALAQQKAEDEYVKAMPSVNRLCFGLVFEDSAEYKAGLSTGDILLKIDGKDVVNYQDYQAVRAANQAQAFTVISRRNGYQVKEVTVRVQPGFKDYIKTFYPMAPTQDYCEWPKDPRWDALAAPAFRLYNTSAEVAETLLYKAEKAGFPDGFSKNALLAGLLQRQGLYAEAMNASWLASKAKPDFKRAQSVFYQAAIATFKLDEGLKMAEAHPTMLGDDADWKLSLLKSNTETWRKVPPEKRAAPFPLDVKIRCAGEAGWSRPHGPRIASFRLISTNVF